MRRAILRRLARTAGEKAEGVTQQTGVEAGKETQNVPAEAAWRRGEQLDRGWEPWGEGLGQGQTRKSPESPLRGPESLQSCFWAADGARQGRDQVWMGTQHSVLHKTIKVQLECSIFKAK